MIWPDDFIDKVLCGDCLTVMKEIPDNSIDLVVTDPPYDYLWFEQDSGGQGGGVYKNSPVMEQIRERELFSFNPHTIIPLLYQKLRRINMYIFANVTLLPDLFELAKQQEAHFDILVMQKPGSPPANNGHYYPDMEYIAFLKKGATFNTRLKPNTMYSKLFTRLRRTHKYHPTQKPLDLVRRYILVSSNEGDIILDPFLGSGTTAVAAKQLGRRYIGIGIVEDYCSIARDRLRQYEMALR